MKEPKATILFRPNRDNVEEKTTAEQFFPLTETRIDLKDQLVIGRYSVLPMYRELERDLKLQGSRLVNSYMEHDYIASFDWYYDLMDLTPKSWFNVQDLPDTGPFVVKGRTNSRKHQWDRMMFAPTKADAIRIYFELLNDPIIADQGVVFRKYEELENFGVGINGQPFANEWRCFFYKDQLLSKGFYWITGDTIPPESEFTKEALAVAQEAADRLKERTNFYVVDVAKTKKGKWIVIEVNDGQCSGLQGNDAEELYSNLEKVLRKE